MRFKALFLLVIFLLNTLVGLACALQMEYKSQEIGAKGHAHDHPLNAHDSASPANTAHNHGSHKHGDSHHETAHKKLELNHSQAGSDEDSSCCQDDVSKFYSLDKTTPKCENVIVKAPISEIALSLYISFHAQLVARGHTKYIETRQRPPTNDIRIAIQSFQI